MASNEDLVHNATSTLITLQKPINNQCEYSKTYQAITHKCLAPCSTHNKATHTCNECEKQPEFYIRLEWTREVPESDVSLLSVVNRPYFRLPNGATLVIFKSDQEAKESHWGKTRYLNAEFYVYSSDEEPFAVCLRCCNICKKMEIKPVPGTDDRLFCSSIKKEVAQKIMLDANSKKIIATKGAKLSPIHNSNCFIFNKDTFPFTVHLPLPEKATKYLKENLSIYFDDVEVKNFEVSDNGIQVVLNKVPFENLYRPLEYTQYSMNISIKEIATGNKIVESEFSFYMNPTVKSDAYPEAYKDPYKDPYNESSADKQNNRRKQDFSPYFGLFAFNDRIANDYKSSSDVKDNDHSKNVEQSKENEQNNKHIHSKENANEHSPNTSREKIEKEIGYFASMHEMTAYKLSLEDFNSWLLMCQKAGFMHSKDNGVKVPYITLYFWAEALKWAMTLWPMANRQTMVNEDLFIKTVYEWMKGSCYQSFKLNYTKGINRTHLQRLFRLILGKLEDNGVMTPIAFVQAIMCLLIPNSCTAPKISETSEFHIPLDLAGAIDFLYNALNEEPSKTWSKFFRGSVARSFSESMMNTHHVYAANAVKDINSTNSTKKDDSKNISPDNAVPISSNVPINVAIKDKVANESDSKKYNNSFFLLRLGEIRLWEEDNEFLAQGLSLVRTWNLENEQEWNHSLMMLQKSNEFFFVDEKYFLHKSLDLWLNLEPNDDQDKPTARYVNKSRYVKKQALKPGL